MHVGCACLSLVRSGADRALKQWSTIELPKYASHFWLGTHINREIEPCAIDEGKAAHGPTLAAGHSRVPLHSASLTCSLTHSLALFVCHTQTKSWWCWRSSWRSTQSGATEDLRNCLSWRAESRSRRRRSKRSLSEGSAHLLGTDCVCVCTLSCRGSGARQKVADNGYTCAPASAPTPAPATGLSLCAIKWLN